jgi:hypothetical protein
MPRYLRVSEGTGDLEREERIAARHVMYARHERRRN